MSGQPKKKKSTKNGWKIAALVVVGLAIVLAVVLSLPEREQSDRIYAAWYVETPTGPLVVAQHSTHLGPVNLGGDTRRDTPAFSATRLYTYNVETGDRVATYSFRRGTETRVIGPAGDRLWLRVGDEPVLLQATDLSIVADAAAIRSAVGVQLGGDFAFTHPSGQLHPYDRHLQLKGADGKMHYVSAALEHLDPDDTRKIPPEGYNCSTSSPELHSPRLLVCFPPSLAPATSLVRSFASALDEDTVLLSAIDANDGARVLWTRPVTELSAGTEPATLLRGQVLTKDRVVVLVQTGDERVDVLHMNPSNGQTMYSRSVIRPAASSG
ncbi:MAG: hypothetical protein AAF799_16225 [Myxococcota bacterium]